MSGGQAQRRMGNLSTGEEMKVSLMPSCLYSQRIKSKMEIRVSLTSIQKVLGEINNMKYVLNLS